MSAEENLCLDRFAVDATTNLGKLVVRGTRLLVDNLVQLVERGRTDPEILQLHPELTADDLEAVRSYARVPEGLRRSFGGWAEHDDGLDEYLDWTRQQRKASRPGIQDEVS